MPKPDTTIALLEGENTASPPVRRPTKVGFISLGCPKNLVDSEVMMGMLAQAGAELIARAALKLIASRDCYALATDVLERSRDTQSQVGLTPHQRRANMRGAFRVKDRGRLSGREVLLVDDVFTTGATLCSAAAALLDVPVCATEQAPDKLGPTVAELQPFPQLVLPKTAFNAEFQELITRYAPRVALA